jgi:hypothetical protein
MQENAPKIARGVAREKISVLYDGPPMCDFGEPIRQITGIESFRAPQPAPSHWAGD